jgi:hypothetical protein
MYRFYPLRFNSSTHIFAFFGEIKGILFFVGCLIFFLKKSGKKGDLRYSNPILTVSEK